MRRALGALAACAAFAMCAQALLAPDAAAAAPDRRYDFTVYLNGTAVGHHVFVLHETADGLDVTSTAKFTYKVLGLTIYRYDHAASERWRGNCLVHLTSHTDANGTLSQVDDDPGGCQMSYAYWNPLILKQNSLINAQSGAQQPVRISEIGADPIMVRGQPVAALRWRIDGPKHPLDLWYSPGGEWLGLESKVGAGRILRYRLEREPPADTAGRERPIAEQRR